MCVGGGGGVVLKGLWFFGGSGFRELGVQGLAGFGVWGCMAFWGFEALGFGVAWLAVGVGTLNPTSPLRFDCVHGRPPKKGRQFWEADHADFYGVQGSCRARESYPALPYPTLPSPSLNPKPKTPNPKPETRNPRPRPPLQLPDASMYWMIFGCG